METCLHIYKKARNEASMTLESAAEALGISVTSLKDYESFNRIPPTLVVERMVVAYDALWLAYKHLRLLSGNIQIVPDVQVRDLPTATIRLINRVRAFSEKHRDFQLMAIAEDGIIDPAERPLFDEIQRELAELLQAGTEINLATEREDVPC